MTSRELVQRTLRFERTERVPRQLWAGALAQELYPEELAAIRRDFPDDIWTPDLPLPRVAGMRGDERAVGAHVDAWGCEFVRLERNVLGEVKRPLIEDYRRDLDKVRPPWEWVAAGRALADRLAAGTDRFVALGTPVNPFERMQFLRGTENLLRDLVRRPAGLLELRDRIHEFNCALLTEWARADVDGLVWSDDWGTQTGLLIHPDRWRELFRPLYADYARIIRGAGKFAFMHSDGQIMAIYEDLIEIGVHALNSQLFCMDIEELGRRYAGRITFWGEIDRQHVLAFGSVAETRAAVRRVARALYRGRGGVIAQCEFGPGARPENVRAVFEEWDRCGAGPD